MMPEREIRKEVTTLLEKPWNARHFLFIDGFGDRAVLTITMDMDRWTKDGRRGVFRVDYRCKGRYDPPEYYDTVDEVVNILVRNQVYGVM